MATIQIKRRASGGASGAPASLAVGEPAYSEVDSILHIGVTGGTVVAVGGTGAFCTLTSSQTVSGAKTFSGGVTFSTTACTFSAAVALGGSATATTPATSDNSTAVATTAYVKAQAGINATGTVTSVALSLPAIFTVSGSPVTTTGTLTAALASQTANTIWAAPNGSAGSPTFRALVAADIPTLTAAKISDFDTQVRTSRLDQMAAPTASVGFGNQRITGLAEPTASSDAATKNYVDNAQLGLEFKQSVKVATTANIDLTTGGLLTIDSIGPLVAGDRVLVKNQTNAVQNGIYLVASGAWTRATDFNSTTTATTGSFVYVDQGTTNAGSAWVCTTTGTITPGTTSISFTQFSGAGSGVPGNYAGQNTITTVGALSSGSLAAGFTTVSVALGGTGATTFTSGRLLMGNGTSAVSVGTPGTDYLTPTNVGASGSTVLDGGTY